MCKDSVLVGYLVVGRFQCVKCCQDPRACPVYRVNIGIYSQVCSVCHRTVVDGVKRGDGKPLSLFQEGLQ